MAIDEAVPCFGCGFRMLTEKFCPKCGTAKPISYIDESLKVEESEAGGLSCAAGGDTTLTAPRSSWRKCWAWPR